MDLQYAAVSREFKRWYARMDPGSCAGDGVEKESGNWQIRCSKVLAWVHSTSWIRPMLVEVKKKTELPRAAVIAGDSHFEFFWGSFIGATAAGPLPSNNQGWP